MIAQSGTDQEAFQILLENDFKHRNTEDALKKVRMRAWERFLELGIPSRQIEAYRYIKLRQLLSIPFQIAENKTITKESLESAIYPECRQSVIVLVNGHYQPSLSNIEALPERVLIVPLEEAIKTYGAFLNNYWTKSMKEETDAFAALNGALHPSGVFIYVPPKTVVETSLQILNVVTDEQQPLLIMPRVHLFVGNYSQMSLVANQKEEGSALSFTNSVIEMAIEEESHVHYTQAFQQENERNWNLTAIRATLKRGSTLKTVDVTEGSATVRTDYRVAITGENAEALLNGVCMLSDKTEAHTHIFIDHQAPNCRSYQLFKTILNDFSRSSFEGKIMVRQAAQKTEAFQLNNNLLLSDHAHADSKPNLEIFADDVKASHGATVGQLDQEQLFYMKTRGFQPKEAMNLLIYGFCEQVLDVVKIPSLQQALVQKAKRYLTKG